MLRPLRMIRDSFRKVVIVGSDIAPYTDDYGISWLGLFDFLLDGKALLEYPVEIYCKLAVNS